MRRIPAALVLAGALVAAGAQGSSRGITVVKAPGAIAEIKGNAGKRFAVCIGVNNYEDADIKDLEKARNDARGLGEAFKREGQFDAVHVMTDEVDPRFDAQKSYPRLANIRARLKYLADFIGPDDLVVVSFSGHGIADERGESYLVVADSSNADPFATSLPLKEVLAWLAGLKVRKSLLLIDACRETLSTRASRGMGGGGLRADRYESAELAAVFYATRNGWYSYEDKDTEYGVFSRFLLEGIRGKADYQHGNKDGIVTFRELAGFVEDSVSGYSLARGLKQRPYTRIVGEAFGDLALAAYSASVDVETRSVASASRPPAAGFGSVRVYSNVDGTLTLDGAAYGELARGRRLVIDELSAGAHFIEIAHDRGTLRKELVVERDSRAEVVNLVLGGEREPRRVRDATFVWVEGKDGSQGFWIGESEVTFGQFYEFARQAGYASKGSWQQYYKPAYELYPVMHVTWDDCAAYAAWFAKKAGVRAALPTAAQWSRAAGGRLAGAYPWGDDWDAEYCHGAESEAPGMLPVIGRRGPVQEQHFMLDITIEGATHLAGNVREWCADRKPSSDGSATLAAVAGGSWRLSRPRFFASDYLSYSPVVSGEEDLGFRLAIAGD